MRAAREAAVAQNDALSAQIADLNRRVAEADRKTELAVAAQNSADALAAAKDRQVGAAYFPLFCFPLDAMDS